MTMNNKKWVLSLLAALAAFVLASLLGVEGSALRFFVITSAALALWISGACPDSLVAVLLPVAYILCGVGASGEILGVWSSPIGWLVLGGLLISAMMSKTGIARRMALWALRVSGASLARLVWGLMLAGFLIAPFVPTGMGKAALFVIILTGICQTLNIKPGSREGSFLFIGGLLAITTPKFIFLTSNIDAALMVEMAGNVGLSISWFAYLKQNLVPGLLYSVGSVLLLSLLLRPRLEVDLKDFVEEEYRELGPLSPAERKALVLMLLLALAMVTDSLHGVDIGWIMLLVAGLCFVPGIRLLGNEDFAALPLHIVFFVVGSMSIGVAARASGVDAAISGALLPLIQSAGESGGFLLVYLSGMSLSMLLTSLPAVSVFGGPLAELGLQLGGAGKGMIYAFLYGMDQYFMPYPFGPALYVFAVGYIRPSSFVFFQAVKFVLTALFLLALALPYWRAVM